MLFDLYSLSWEDLFPRKMIKHVSISIANIFEGEVPSASAVSDDPTNQGGSAPVRPASALPEC